MANAIVYNLPLLSVLALTVIRLILLIGMLRMAWADTPRKTDRKGLIKLIVKDLQADSFFVTIAVLLLLSLQMLIWAFAPAASSFSTVSNLLFSQTGTTAIYST